MPRHAMPARANGPSQRCWAPKGGVKPRSQAKWTDTVPVHKTRPPGTARGTCKAGGSATYKETAQNKQQSENIGEHAECITPDDGVAP